jgi:hypothetical protein
MKIIVMIKDVYGEKKAYPHCDLARKFADLVGTKTLTRDALSKIKALGYEIEAVFPSDFPGV